MPKRRRATAGMGWGKILPLLILLVALIVIVFQSNKQGHHTSTNVLQGPVSAGTAQWEVYFSPNGGCTDAIADTISAAEQSIFVQAYSFTSQPIAEALVDAKRRGVDVQVILDESNKTAHASADEELLDADIPTFIDAAHAIAHNKIVIIDGKIVITGSFNFTRAAEERNAENLLILRSPELAKRYSENWQTHREHSNTYTR